METIAVETTNYDLDVAATLDYNLVCEKEYTISFLDIQESLFYSLKQKFSTTVVRIFTTGDDCKTKEFKKKLNIPPQTITKLRKSIQYKGGNLIIGHTPITSIVNELKTLISIDNCFFTHKNDLIPYMKKVANEYKFHKKILNFENDSHVNTTTRWNHFTNYKNNTIRISFDEYEHYTKRTIYSIHVELECKEFSSDIEHCFVEFLKDESCFFIEQLLDDISLTPFSPIHLSQIPIKRPFSLTHSISNQEKFAYFGYKLDGERAFGILNNQGLLFYYSDGIGKIEMKNDLKQLYLVSVEVLNGGHDIRVIDVNMVIHLTRNLNTDAGSNAMIFDYNPIIFNIPITTAINYINTHLCHVIPCNRFFSNIKEMIGENITIHMEPDDLSLPLKSNNTSPSSTFTTSATKSVQPIDGPASNEHSIIKIVNHISRLSYSPIEKHIPIDGALAFSDSCIVKLKPNHTIELAFHLKAMLTSLRTKKKIITPRGNEREKCELPSLLSKQLRPTLNSLDVIKQIPTHLLDNLHHFFFTREKIAFHTHFNNFKLVFGNIKPIDFLHKLLITPDSNVVNNFAIVEFIWRNEEEKHVHFLKMRRDKFTADSIEKISNILL